MYRSPCTLQKLEELKHCQEEELEERLDAGVKRILGANRRLAEELRLAQNALNEITGAFSSDDLLGVIFSSFCIGK